MPPVGGDTSRWEPERESALWERCHFRVARLGPFFGFVVGYHSVHSVKVIAVSHEEKQHFALGDF